MSLPVVFRPQAEDEVLRVRHWYDKRREGLGDEFTAEVEALIGLIVERPTAFRCVRDETRRGIMRRFPYAIYFRLTATEVVILAVHGRQHPASWQTRR